LVIFEGASEQDLEAASHQQDPDQGEEAEDVENDLHDARSR
jgi:hypothetical protein